VTREELVAALSVLCVSCQPFTAASRGQSFYRHRSCDLCSGKMAKIMVLVDTYVDTVTKA
jgi:hypothetical protein